MTVRTRGFVIFLGSAVAGAALLGFRSGFLLKAASAGLLGRVLQWLLALPLLGVAVGLLECATDMPLSRVDEGWQRLPLYVKLPAGFIGGGAFLWAFLWIVAKGLGA